jgi:hypothetical protein
MASVKKQSIARMNGEPALTIGIFKTQDANLVAVADELDQAVDKLRQAIATRGGDPRDFGKRQLREKLAECGQAHHH